MAWLNTFIDIAIHFSLRFANHISTESRLMMRIYTCVYACMHASINAGVCVCACWMDLKDAALIVPQFPHLYFLLRLLEMSSFLHLFLWKIDGRAS